MREIEIPLLPGTNRAAIERAVERVCTSIGLTISLRGTLASYPGSLHWHIKRDRRSGTLEVTFAPETWRLWLSVHAGREGDWIDDALVALPGRIRHELERGVSAVDDTSSADVEGG